VTIEVSGLSFTYPASGGRAIDGLDFRIEPGEIFGFLGPNGAGKSTTQKVLTGQLRGFEGRVSLLGRPLESWGSEVYEHIGVVFELPNHYLKLTALENLTYFRALYGGRTRSPRELLERVGLAESADRPVGQFSKGMKSRLSVARALLNDPEVLFLDEPTAGLDPVSSRRIRDLVLEQRGLGRTIFLTTHDMAVADRLCDRVAFLVGGRIERVDSPRSLKLRYGDPRVRVERGDAGDAERAEFPLAGLGDNEAFLDLLRRGEVRTLHSLEATLEDVFIQVTGKRLR
jgi:fluoroquinolone transport system ATP-binding protein